MLYFFQGHHTKEQDFIAIKEFQKFTNIIPILAKGDEFTPEELKLVKENILKDGNEYQVKFFDIIYAIDKLDLDKEAER
jgi:septin family protein